MSTLWGTTAWASAAVDTRRALHASRQAAPSWASPSQRSRPQLDDVEEVFHSLRHHETDAISDGVLVCTGYVKHPKRWDAFAAPDLNVTVAIGRGPEAASSTFHGPQDTSSFAVSMPLVTLKLRTKVSLSVVDRDVFHKEFIGKDVDVFAGEIPLTFDAGTFSAECRVLHGEALQHRTSEAQKEAASALAHLQRTQQVRPSAPHLGFDVKQQQRVHRRLVALAALTGWQGAEVARLVDDDANHAAAFAARAVPHIKKLRAKAQLVSTQKRNARWRRDGVRIHPLQLSCSTDVVTTVLQRLPKSDAREAAECVVRLRLTKKTGGRTGIHQRIDDDAMPRLLTSDGRLIALRPLGVVGDAVRKVRQKNADRRRRNQASSTRSNRKKADDKLDMGMEGIQLQRGDTVEWVLAPAAPIDEVPLLRVPTSSTKVTTWAFIDSDV